MRTARGCAPGEAVADLAPLIERFAPETVLINCSRPEAVADGLRVIREFGRPFGAYANGFTRISEDFLKAKPTVDVLTARRDLDPAAYAGLCHGLGGAGRDDPWRLLRGGAGTYRPSGETASGGGA